MLTKLLAWDNIRIFDKDINVLMIIYVFLTIIALGLFTLFINLIIIKVRRKRSKNNFDHQLEDKIEKDFIDYEIYSITKSRKKQKETGGKNG